MISAMSLPTDPGLIDTKYCLLNWKLPYPVLLLEINKPHFYKQFGSVSASSIKIEKPGYTMEFTPNKSLIDEPRMITEINTKYKLYKLSNKLLYNPVCANEEDIGQVAVMTRWFDSTISGEHKWNQFKPSLETNHVT